MTIGNFFKYIKSNKNEFIARLEECIENNNIETTNEDYPLMQNLYASIQQSKINEVVKPTTGKINIMVER